MTFVSASQFHSVLKALVGAFNQEKALVGAFSVIVQLHRLIDLRHYSAAIRPHRHQQLSAELHPYLTLHNTGLAARLLRAELVSSGYK